MQNINGINGKESNNENNNSIITNRKSYDDKLDYTKTKSSKNTTYNSILIDPINVKKVNLEVKYTPNIQLWNHSYEKSLQNSPLKELNAEVIRHEKRLKSECSILKDINILFNKLDICNINDSMKINKSTQYI